MMEVLERGRIPGTRFPEADEYSNFHRSSAQQRFSYTTCWSPSSSTEHFHKYHPRPLEYNQLPSYIESEPPHVTEDMQQFLNYKNALSIPNDRIRQALWAAYWKYAHPCMPVLDQIEVNKSIQGCGEKISLLLYQCIMLVGQVFLIAHESPNCEFDDTKELFARSRALYDFGWETRPLVILQSLILMTFFPQKVNEPKGQAYLVGHAVSIAYIVGLHRDPTNSHGKAHIRHLRKRLWWSLFIRERALLLDQGTPWIIDSTDYDVPMVKIEDFCLSDVCHRGGTRSPVSDLNDISRQRKFAIMWIERAKLAVIMGHLPPMSVHIPESGSGMFERPSLQSGLPHSKEFFKDIEVCLERWQGDIAPEINFSQPSSPALWAGDRELYLHCASLKLLYHIVKFQLAVSLALPRTQTQTVQFPWNRTRQVARESYNAIIQSIKDFKHYKCSMHVSLYGSSVVRPVLIRAILTGILGGDTCQSSGFDLLHFDIEMVDSYQCLFKRFLLCDTY